MRFASRIRSLQRRLKAPWSLDENDPALLALYTAVFGDPTPPRADPPAPGSHVSASRDAVTKVPEGQEAPETDKFSPRPCSPYARRAILLFPTRRLLPQHATPAPLDTGIPRE